jgi:hypothetical protein
LLLLIFFLASSLNAFLAAPAGVEHKYLPVFETGLSLTATTTNERLDIFLYKLKIN